MTRSKQISVGFRPLPQTTPTSPWRPHKLNVALTPRLVGVVRRLYPKTTPRAQRHPRAVAAAILQAVALPMLSCLSARAGVRPRLRAAAVPSRVRSEISRRSKCAIAPKTWNTSSPAAEEVSRRSSRGDDPGPARRTDPVRSVAEKERNDTLNTLCSSETERTNRKDPQVLQPTTPNPARRFRNTPPVVHPNVTRRGLAQDRSPPPAKAR